MNPKSNIIIFTAFILIVVIDIIAVKVIKKEKFSLTNTIFPICFFTYIFIVLYVTVFNNIGAYLILERKAPNIIPFNYSIDNSQSGRHMFYLAFYNILLFVPFGLMCPIILKRNKYIYSTLFAFIFTFLIEFIQYFIGRISDIDDLICNFIGGIIGIFGYVILKQIYTLIKAKKAGY